MNENALRDLKFSRSGAESGQIFLSDELATACFMPESSRFLAFAKWSADKMQLAKVLRSADIDLKT